MPQEIENNCCRLTHCIKTDRFAKLSLDQDEFKLCVRNIGAIRNDREDNSTRSFHKAAYRQIILARHGHLCPSCVVLRFDPVADLCPTNQFPYRILLIVNTFEFKI